jgi:uncharacterized surface protein with fasciclin (FAS1) repeats
MKKALGIGIVAMVLIIASCATPAEPAVEKAASEETKTEEVVTLPSIAEIAVEDGRFTTLVAALDAAGLVETLSSDGAFTVFAPTDDAFAALPAGTVEGLLENIPALTDVLLYHVVSGHSIR